MRKKPRKPDFVCPNCGNMVPGNARACPHCGSDEDTGWAPNSEFSYLDPSFDKDDYEELCQREFGAKPNKRPFAVIIAIVSFVLIVLWIYYAIF